MTTQKLKSVKSEEENTGHAFTDVICGKCEKFYRLEGIITGTKDDLVFYCETCGADTEFWNWEGGKFP